MALGESLVLYGQTALSLYGAYCVYTQLTAPPTKAGRQLVRLIPFATLASGVFWWAAQFSSGDKSTHSFASMFATELRVCAQTSFLGATAIVTYNTARLFEASLSELPSFQSVAESRVYRMIAAHFAVAALTLLLGRQNISPEGVTALLLTLYTGILYYSLNRVRFIASCSTSDAAHNARSYCSPACLPYRKCKDNCLHCISKRKSCLRTVYSRKCLSCCGQSALHSTSWRRDCLAASFTQSACWLALLCR